MSVAAPAARYVGTGGTFLRTGGWSVLLDVQPDHALVDRCWDLLGATADPDEVLETVAAQALPVVTALALVRETGVRRVFAWGAVGLVLDTTDVVPDQHAGAWITLPLADVSTLEVALTSGAQAETPPPHALQLRDGVVAARGFHLVLEPDARSGGDTLERLQVTALRPPAPAAASSEDTLPAAFTTGLPPRTEPRAAGDRSVRVEAPRVLAAVCPAGHLTPAYSAVCRVCRRVVATQEAFETARPALGRLLLPSSGRAPGGRAPADRVLGDRALGDSVLLDRGAVLGRAPHVPAGWTGAQPRLVALPDPDHDVSAQHASVVLDLWNVLVCDLGSTNGTALVDQGGRVTRLRPYEPAALQVGGAVVLADVVTLRFEVHP